MHRAPVLIMLLALAGCYAFSRVPPGDGYVRFTDVAPGYKDFVPGLGAVYVQPEKRPTGPYRAYDRSGKLTATIYMVAEGDLERQIKVICGGPIPTADHIQVHYTKGHAGFETPHHHITLWHISQEEVENVK